MKQALRKGAAILFAVAILVFLSTFAYQLWAYGDVLNGLQTGSYEGPKPSWLTLVTALSGALNSAALPFIGACVVDRIDRYLASKDAAE